MKMFSEFKTFIARGNVIDLAVGVVIGAAFTAIVNSLVTDIINPVIGMAIGGVDFSSYAINLNKTPLGDLGGSAPIIHYGLFINAVVKFLIVAFVVFIMVKQINRLKSAPPAKGDPAPPEDIQLLREIRDALVKDSKKKAA